MSTYDLVADLPLSIESYGVEGLSLVLGPEFTRHTTVLTLSGKGEEGVGEDVVYDESDQLGMQEAGPALPMAGEWTIDSFAEHLSSLDLFPVGPSREDSVLYRRWTYESAALDLALRQAGRSLHEVVGKEMKALTYVVSMRLPDDPPSLDPLLARLRLYPSLRFKLDPQPSWDDAFMAELKATGAVDSLDFKGLYTDTPVDVEPDPAMYLRAVQTFPDAWLEDPKLLPEIDEILEPHRDRVTWDAPIHSVSDIEALPFPPRMVNIKPSRFGPLKSLFAGYDYCEEHGIGAYGGGQTELGPGRGQIQYLASLFHPDTPNDVSPLGFHATDPPPGIPESPLTPAPSPTGFRWQD